jgi:hypothetical protein
MVYLAKKNGKAIHHTSKEAMKALDGVSKPERTVTDAEFEAASGLVRIINGEIFLGKTEAEMAADNAKARISEIDNALAVLDAKYLTPRILSGIGVGDAYALSQKEKHDAEAVPLREERDQLVKNIA